MMVAGTTTGQCVCPHSMRVHRNGYGRCLSEGCPCMFGPAPQLRPTRTRTPGKVSERSKLEALLLRRIELAGLPMPEVQYRWARDEGRQYRSDGAYVEARVLLEVQGGIWAADAGRHNRGSGYEEDCRRDNLAALLRWTLLRFTERMIKDGTAAETIRRALEGHR